MEKYRIISCEKFPVGKATTYEKTVGCFTFTLDSYGNENHHGVNFRITKGEEFIAAIKSSYFPNIKQLTIEDMGTHPSYRQIGLGKLRLKEVLSFLISNSQAPETVVAEGVITTEDAIAAGMDSERLSQGEKFVKAIGFRQIGNSDCWQISFEELVKRLQKNKS